MSAHAGPDTFSGTLFQAAFNSLGICYSVTDVETGCYVDVNEAWASLMGWTREEMLGRPSTEFRIWQSTEDRDRVAVDIDAGGRINGYYVRVHTRSGEQKSILMDGDEIEVEGRRYLLISAVNLTEREQMEERLRHSQKMEAIGRLSGGLAHDFNNMLSIIIGNSQMALREDNPEPTIRSLENILDAAESGTRLIRQLMTLSRSQHLAPEAFRLRDRLEALKPLFESTAGENIRLTMTGEDQVVCMLDKSQTDSALLNLVLNARDAIAGTGSIAIASRELVIPEARAKALSISVGLYVEVTVTDNGAGLREEEVRQVFEPFFSGRLEEGGNGLGLSLVYGFVSQSGGTVQIDSVLGRGTTVTMLLPATTEEVQEEPARVESGEDVSELRILLIEDNPGVRNVVLASLQLAGASVQAFEDGSALSSVSAGEFDVLVTDVMLPGEERGPDIARQLLARNPALRVVFMSGYDQGLLSEIDFTAEQVQFLPKPFTHDQLMEVLSGLALKK